jgi:methylmalonyl-CoA mutase
MEKELKVKLQAIFAEKDRVYSIGDLPKENNGLALLLLGVTGDQILPEKVYQKIKKESICKFQGTVQAAMLKENQAQNICIFSIDFALKMRGDTQQYFIEDQIQNFYSVSISEYPIAEVRTNPIIQLAYLIERNYPA